MPAGRRPWNLLTRLAAAQEPAPRRPPDTERAQAPWYYRAFPSRRLGRARCARADPGARRATVAAACALGAAGAPLARGPAAIFGCGVDKASRSTWSIDSTR